MGNGYFWEVVLGALFHDYGKFARHTAGKYYSHPYLTYVFLSKYKELRALLEKAGLNYEIMTLSSSYHHEREEFGDYAISKIPSKEARPYAEIVCQADNLSATERSEDTNRTQNPFMNNILDLIGDSSIEQPRVFNTIPSHELSEVSDGDLFVLEDKVDTVKIQRYYDKFMEDFKMLIANYEGYGSNSKDEFMWSFCLSLISLIDDYLWCIASDITRKIRDVSLADHLKTTAAISGCLYRYAEENYKLQDADWIRKLAKSNEKWLILIAGDFSGIQQFIFNIRSGPGSRYAAKRLRARSFLVEMIVTSTAFELLRRLGLSPANMIFNQAGKFYLLAPNTPKVVSLLRDFKKEFENYFFTKEFSALGLNLAWVEITGQDLSLGNSENGRSNFARVLRDVETALEAQKFKPFGSLLLDEDGWVEDRFEAFGSKETSYRCPVCGVRQGQNDRSYRDLLQKLELPDDSEEYGEVKPCEKCTAERMIGTLLPKAKCCAIMSSKTDKSVQITPYSYISFSDKPNDLRSAVAAIDLQNTREVFWSRYLKYPAFYLPRLTEEDVEKIKKLEEREELEMEESFEEEFTAGFPKTFFHMAYLTEGDNKLAYIKSDVDNLGYILAKEFSNLTISRYATFARLLNTFFSQRLMYVIKHTKKGSKGKKGNESRFKNVYIVFSGGDDLFTVAGWWEGLELVKELQESFRNWAKSSLLTFSTAIVLYPPRTPISSAARDANGFLSKVKQSNGGEFKVSLLGKVTDYEKLVDVLQLAEELAESVKSRNSKLPRSNLQMLIDIYEEGLRQIQENHLPVYLAHLAYYRKRHIEEAKNGVCNTLVRAIDEVLRKGNFEELEKIALAARLAHFLTRGKEGKNESGD